MNDPAASPLTRMILNLAVRLLPPVRRLQNAYRTLSSELEQAQAQQAATEQQARIYEALFDQTLDAVAIFDLDGPCIKVNRRMGELLGYAEDEMIGMAYHSLAVDQDKSRRIFERIVGGEVVAAYECEIWHKNGQAVDIEASTTLVRDAAGQPLHAQAIIRDIRERQKVATALADQNRLLQTVIDNMPDFVYVKDRERRFIINNIAHARSMGLSPADVVGKTDADLFPPELAEIYLADEERVLANDQPLINREEPSLSVDGEPIWALSSKVPLHDSSGAVVGLIGVTRDITERKLREKQMEDNERFVNKVTATIPDVLYVYDFEANVYRYYNGDAISRILGYDEDEFHRADQSFMMEIMHPDDRAEFENWFERFSALGENEVLETRYRLMHKDGNWRHFYSRDQVFARNAAGVPVQSLGLAQDMTKEVDAEQKLRRQNEYLRALSEVTPAIVNRFDAENILNTVLTRVKALMQTEFVFMEMIAPPSEDQPGYLHIQRFGGGEYFVRPGEGVVGRVVQTGEMVTVEDYRNWPYRVNTAKLAHVRASIGVPLKSGDRVVGVLGVSYDDAEHSFNSAEIDILSRIVDLASIALDNAQLYTAAQTELAERVRAEAELRASEERYRAVIESQTELVARFLPDLTLSFVNNAYCRFFDLAPDALVGQSFEGLVAGEDRAGLRRHIEALSRSTPAQTAAFRFRRPDGALRWLQCSNRAIFGADGQVAEYQMVARDVTEQRQAEEALRLGEARYRAVVDSQTELICRFSSDNILTFVNDAYCRYFDQTPDQVLGRPMPPRIPAEDWARIEPILQAQLRGELEVAHYEHRVITASGEVRWQQWTDRVIYDEGGDVLELQAVGRDITERKQAELALNAERDFVAAILDNTVGLLVVADRDGRMVTFNRACEALSGYRFDEVEGTFLWDKLLLPDEAEQVKQVFLTVVAGNYPNKNVNHWVTRDGQQRLIEWSNTVLTDEHGQVTHIVSSGVDISARRQLDERNLELALEREKVKILGNFIRDVSHDFRTPLSILNTNLYLLRRSGDSPGMVPRFNEMEQQVVHLTHLIDQLLTMTRLDSEADVNMVELSVNDVLRNVSASLMKTVTSKNLTLDLKLADDLPPLWADAWQVNQALRNIVNNAVQFTPEGGSITVETSQMAGQAVVRITDTGIGIAADDLPHIFERFYRADKARSGDAGTGLGLAIARKIIDIHNGAVTVESTPGEGTTFTIMLPVHVGALNGSMAD